MTASVVESAVYGWCGVCVGLYSRPMTGLVMAELGLKK